jgi:GMP synthase (glutamine-hydrolysing)
VIDGPIGTQQRAAADGNLPQSAAHPRVLVIEHEPAAGPGLVGGWLTGEGLELVVCRPYLGEAVPSRVEADGLLVLGGSVGPNDDDVAPWLPATRALLRAAVADEVPTWGICLGAQLMAVALGGEVQRGENGPEAGVLELDVDDVDDALFGALPDRPSALQFHQDAITRLPEGSTLLASTPAYVNQAFRVGSCAWAVQFHPEVTADIVQAWARHYSHVVTDGGRDSDEVVAELAERQGELAQTWAPVARRWAAEVRRRVAAVAAG